MIDFMDMFGKIRSFDVLILGILASIGIAHADSIYTWNLYETGFPDDPVLAFSYDSDSPTPPNGDISIVLNYYSPYAPPNVETNSSPGLPS